MTIKEIDALLEEGQSLKAIAQAYSEIANLKIKRIRGAVERNRLFFEEISNVYSFVKAFALKKKLIRHKPKKRLDILITSNYKFYGNINSSLIKYFLGLNREFREVDKIIIGKGGIDFFRATKLLTNYHEVELKDDMPTPLELSDLVKVISQYNQVLVFYSKLKSLLSQQATFTDLTAISFYIQAFQVEGKLIQFIFEPELPKIVAFFESQILNLLLEQTFLESELSRTASRFISMDQAESQANKFIKEHQKLKGYTKRSLLNNQILENYARMIPLRNL